MKQTTRLLIAAHIGGGRGITSTSDSLRRAHMPPRNLIQAAIVAFTLACADPVRMIEAPTDLAEARASSGITIIDLGSISVDGASVARSVNRDGVIVGYAFTRKYEPDMYIHAMRWTVSPAGAVARDDLMSALALPPTADAQALSVNDAGSIAGVMRTSDQQYYHGFVLTAGNVATDVSAFPRCDGAPDQTNYSTVRDINNRGEIVGEKTLMPYVAGNPAYSYYADLNAPNPCVVQLPGLDTQPSGAAYSINDSSVIVGEGNDATTSWAIRWRNVGGIWTASRLGRERTRAWSINIRGDVAGQFNAVPERIDQRALLWKNTGGVLVERELGALDAATQSVANDVDSTGRVVGWAHNRQLYMRAFDWTESAGMRDLGTLGEKRAGAWAVSGKRIVGDSELPAPGRQITSHAVLWILP